MKTNTEKDEEVCWACKRTLVGESNFGLCPNCIDKYGSPLAAISTIGFTSLFYFGKGSLKKNSGKVLRGAIDAIKHIKS